METDGLNYGDETNYYILPTHGRHEACNLVICSVIQMG